jgi:bacteriocin biosynthesis cyclodehydratase domain-containing protein
VAAADLAVGGATPADLDRLRSAASADAIMRAAPETDTRTMREGAPTFVVHIGLGAPAELIALRYARQELPHLLIEERDGTILIGPLIPSSGRPCLNCVDLHRRDHDPAWPAVVAQLSTGAEAPFSTPMATTMIAAGVAAAQVLSYIDVGRASTIGASFEINGTTQHRRRTWTPHPRCDCAARKRVRGGGMRRSEGS